MKKYLISFLTFVMLIVSTGGYSYATQNDKTQSLASEGFYLENSTSSNPKKLTIFTSDGNPLANGYVQIYSLDQNKYVFLGQTDKKGRVDFKIANNKSDIKDKFKSKNVNILDFHYIIFAGNDEEVATEGMTISYGINNSENLKSLLDNDIFTKDTDIPNKIETRKFSNNKDFKSNNTKDESSIMSLTNSLISSDTVIAYETPIWHLSQEKFVASKETAVANVNICDGVQSSFDMSKSNHGTVTLSGGSFVTAEYSSGSTITCSSDLASGSYSGTHRIYKTYFDYYDQLWVSTWGEMTKLVSKDWKGYVNKYDSYESMCTPAHLSDAYSQGYITVQGGQSKSINYGSGLSISGAAEITSVFTGTTYSINATYTSSTESALTRYFSTDHSSYLVYPQTSENYVIPQ